MDPLFSFSFLRTSDFLRAIGHYPSNPGSWDHFKDHQNYSPQLAQNIIKLENAATVGSLQNTYYSNKYLSSTDRPLDRQLVSSFTKAQFSQPQRIFHYNMTSTLAGRNAIVTGSARGIGAQIALDLAKAGANVLLNYKSPSSAPKVEAIVKEIHRVNPSVRVGILHADVGDEDIGQKFLKASTDVFTDGDISQLKIHILVHNAADARRGFLETETLESINGQLQANIRGPFLITQALRPYIPSHDNARILFISSMAARFCGPAMAIYTACKVSNESFARTWTNEFGAKQGITINSLNPGPVQTDLWDDVPEEFKQFALQKMPLSTPRDVSNVVLFFASKESKWISGSIVPINGGDVTL